MATVLSELVVDGMTGKYCVHLIKTTLESIQGVQWLDVDFSSRKVSAVYEPDRIDIADIIRNIRALGYSIRGFRELGFLSKVV